MAPPIAGTCDVPMPPTILPTLCRPVPGRCGEAFLELGNRRAGLLRTDVLHVEAVDADELREIVDVAALREQLEHVPVPHGGPLRVAQSVAAAVTVLVSEKRGAIRGIVEREAHLVQSV